MMRQAFKIADALGSPRGDNFLLGQLGRWLIPSLGFVKATIQSIDDDRIDVRIPLARRTKNHLGSMYFGVLAAGADTAAGFLALRHMRAIDPDVTLIFKDFRAEFLRRVDGHAHFICEDGQALREAVQRASDSGDRVNVPTDFFCYCEGNDQPAARFQLTVSLKVKR